MKSIKAQLTHINVPQAPLVAPQAKQREPKSY